MSAGRGRAVARPGSDAGRGGGDVPAPRSRPGRPSHGERPPIHLRGSPFRNESISSQTAYMETKFVMTSAVVSSFTFDSKRFQ